MDIKELCELKYLLRRFKEDYNLDSMTEFVWVNGILKQIDEAGDD